MHAFLLSVASALAALLALTASTLAALLPPTASTLAALLPLIAYDFLRELTIQPSHPSSPSLAMSKAIISYLNRLSASTVEEKACYEVLHSTAPVSFGDRR